jgi:hypothetical protein
MLLGLTLVLLVTLVVGEWLLIVGGVCWCCWCCWCCWFLLLLVVLLLFARVAEGAGVAD